MKKTLLLLSLFLILFQGFAQQLPSSLTKGLIFSTKLDEWGQGRDEASGIMPTKTDVYNVADRQGSGSNRSLSFNGTSDYVTLPTIPAFGTGDFTIIFKCNLKSNTQTLLDGGVNSLNFYIDADYKISIGKNGVGTAGKSSTVLAINTDYTIGYKRSGTTGSFIINGAAESTTITDSYNYSVADNKFGAASYNPDGSISMCRIFNYALSAQQVINYSRPEYPIEWVDRGISGFNPGSELVVNGNFTSGDTGWNKETGWTIVDQGGGNYKAVATSAANNYTIRQNIVIQSGKSYLAKVEISDYSSGIIKKILAETYVGTEQSADGVYSEKITATATLTTNAFGFGSYIGAGPATTLKIDNVSVVQLGCVLDLNAEGLGKSSYTAYDATKWSDFTNGLTATVSGATVVIPSASNLSATYLNGSTCQIALTSAPMVAGSADRSISIWVNPLLITGGARMIYCAGTTATHGQFYVYIGSTGALRVGDNTIEVALTSTGYFSLNTWYHIVVTIKGGIASAYINGEKTVTELTITGLNTVSGNTYIGTYSDGLSPFYGIISDVYGYSKVLDQDQIKLLYDLGH